MGDRSVTKSAGHMRRSDRAWLGVGALLAALGAVFWFAQSAGDGARRSKDSESAARDVEWVERDLGTANSQQLRSDLDLGLHDRRSAVGDAVVADAPPEAVGYLTLLDALDLQPVRRGLWELKREGAAEVRRFDAEREPGTQPLCLSAGAWTLRDASGAFGGFPEVVDIEADRNTILRVASLADWTLRVTDERGAPISGASVFVRTEAPQRWFTANGFSPFVAAEGGTLHRTDQDGRIHAPRRAGGPTRVTAVAAGFEGASAVLAGGMGRDATVALARSTATDPVRVLVLDRKTGAPLPNALLSTRELDIVGPPSDTLGFLEFEMPARTGTSAIVSAPGYAPFRFAFFGLMAGETPTLRLAQLVDVLVGLDGAAATERMDLAWVCRPVPPDFAPDPEYLGAEVLLGRWRSEWNPPDGDFVLQVPELCSLSIRGFGSDANESWHGEAAPVVSGTRVLLTAERDVPIRVRVVLPPVGDLRGSVWLRGAESRYPVPQRISPSHSWPARGIKRIEFRVDDGPRIDLIHRTYGDTAGDGAPAEVELDLSEYRPVRVTVVDSDGVPLSGTWLRVKSLDTYIGSHPELQGARPTTDPRWLESSPQEPDSLPLGARGDRTVWLRPGRHRYWIAAESPETASGPQWLSNEVAATGVVNVLPEQSELVLTAPRKHWSELEMIDGLGQPAGSGTLQLVDAQGAVLESRTWNGSQFGGWIPDSAARAVVQNDVGWEGSVELPPGPERVKVVLVCPGPLTLPIRAPEDAVGMWYLQRLPEGLELERPVHAQPVAESNAEGYQLWRLTVPCEMQVPDARWRAILRGPEGQELAATAPTPLGREMEPVAAERPVSDEAR